MIVNAGLYLYLEFEKSCLHVTPKGQGNYLCFKNCDECGI
jgi:hypothetical protein